MSDLRERLEERIRTFLEVRGRPADDPSHIRSAMRALDEFWWKKVHQILEARAPESGGTLTLDPAERRLVDAGHVDPRLTADDGSLEKSLDDEFSENVTGNIYYLSEWLQYRWQLDAAVRNVDEEVAQGVSHFRDNLGYKDCHITRMECVAKLQHLLRGLPGVTPPIYDTLVSGRLMMHLEDMTFAELTHQVQTSESDIKLVKFFKALLLRLRERCLTKPLQEAFTHWMQRQDRIHRIIQDAARDVQVESTLQRRRIEQEVSSRGNMAGNLRLLRSLIPLGVAGSDMAVSFSPLFEDGKRLTKSSVRGHWTHLRDADPLLPGDPDILIAPYAGNGFFEWDHNTLILPVTSEHSRGWALVHAVANYRIMTDALNFEGQLRREWIKQFGADRFKERFVDAYHNWVLGIGKGKPHAVNPEKFMFFVKNIGPNPQKGIGPTRLLKLDNESQIQRLKECRTAINAGNETFEFWYDLAVIHWRRHNIREAHEAMIHAHELNPDDPRVDFSRIYLGQKISSPTIQKEYADLIQKHPDTLWRVYAGIQLESDRL